MMDGFLLLVGHLIGDYVVQNDWMAANKTNPYTRVPPGPLPPEADREFDRETLRLRSVGNWACTAHCLLYTLAVWACSFWWMPWWGLVACFAIHWPVDRWRLAGRWMRNVSGQSAFAGGPLAPWSVIVVDNTFHLATLGVIAAFAGRVNP